MQSNGTRIAAVLVTLAAVVVLFFVFKGGDDDGDSTAATTSARTTATQDEAAAVKADKSGEDAKKKSSGAGSAEPVITIVNGQPEGGVADLEFKKGDEIRFAVDSDTADEVHVHGYDIMEDVKAGGKVQFDFPADIDGVFEVELEGSATQIAELTVNP